MPSGPDIDVWVLDTSALIEIQDLLERDPIRLLSALDALGAMARDGTVAFPEEVVDELCRFHDDPVSRWAKEHFPHLEHSGASFDVVRHVIQEVEHITDRRKTTTDADPFVVALALELHTQDYLVMVVTEDVKDKPFNTSVATGCYTVGVRTITTGWFIEQAGI